MLARMLKMLAVASAAVLLGAATTKPPPLDCKPTRIVLNGDSTAWGFLARGGGTRAAVYPELALQWAMDARFGYGVVSVETGAVSGATSADAISQRRDGDIIVYNPGINDVAHKISAEAYRANLRQLAKVPGAVFQTPTPVWNQPAYDAVMREVAAEAGVPLVDSRAWALKLSDWWKYATDGVHITSEGNEAHVREVLFPALEPIVMRRCRVPE
jgi:lysophospholipase L1-like esterase